MQGILHGILEGLTQFLILGLRTTLRHSRLQRDGVDGVFLKISRFEIRNTKGRKKRNGWFLQCFLETDGFGSVVLQGKNEENPKN